MELLPDLGGLAPHAAELGMSAGCAEAVLQARIYMYIYYVK